MIIYGVVDRRDHLGESPDLDIIVMDADSDNARRFNWGASCSGWYPITTFPTLEDAELFIKERERQS